MPRHSNPAYPIFTEGRPDFGRSGSFGTTNAKRFPPFVYGTTGNSCLIHRVDRVALRWYEVAKRGECLQRLMSPRMTVFSVCGYMFHPSVRKANLCEIPLAGAVHCGRCNGDIPTFRKGREKTTRQYARVHLGCVVEGVVANA